MSVLEAADFASLKPLYRPPFTVSGGFTYTLTYRDKTVVALEGGVPVACKDRLPRWTGCSTVQPPEGAGDDTVSRFTNRNGLVRANGHRRP
ncbi:MAG TPA: hypothetical protein VF526_15195 [Solirubrobacteraceae bacterium]